MAKPKATAKPKGSIFASQADKTGKAGEGEPSHAATPESEADFDTDEVVQDEHEEDEVIAKGDATAPQKQPTADTSGKKSPVPTKKFTRAEVDAANHRRRVEAQKQSLVEADHSRHINKLGRQLAYEIRLKRLAQRERVVADLIEERDALKARVAELEAQLSPAG